MSRITIAHPQAIRGLDLNETPPCATRALIRAGHVWEPATGNGAIVRELRAVGHSDEWVEHFPVVRRIGHDCRATRQRFSRRQEVDDEVERESPFDDVAADDVDLSPRVYMLLRLSLLEGTGRSDILESRDLARVHVFRDRVPHMHRDNWTGKKARSALAYAWFVCVRGHNGRPEVRRMSTKL